MGPPARYKPWLATVVVAALGCGTTRMSHTSRTATEQLLISDAVDRAVEQIDVSALRGESVYLDTSALSNVQDRNYIVSTLRQHLLANGVTLRDNLSEADVVVEARAGAVGTGGSELLYGVPAMNLPTFGPLASVPTSLPEIPLIKRTDQQGVAKLAVFAFERETGEPIWQSGQSLVSSNARDLWILGAGPFQTGSLFEGTSDQVRLQLAPNPITLAARLFQKRSRESPRPKADTLTVLKEKYFGVPVQRVASTDTHGDRDRSPRAPTPTGAPSGGAQWLPPVDIPARPAEQRIPAAVPGAPGLVPPPQTPWPAPSP